MSSFFTIGHSPALAGLQNVARKWGIFILLALFSPLLPAHAETTNVPYEVEIKCSGEAPPEMKKILKEVSETVQKKSDPPPSMALLKRRTEEDLPEMKKVLRSFGFFKGKISVKISPPASGKPAGSGLRANSENPEEHTPPGGMPAVPANVLFQVDPGSRFLFAKASIRLAEKTPKDTPAPPSSAETGIVEHAPYAAAKVVEAGNFLLTHYKNNGYPFPKVAHRDVVADFATNTVQVKFQMDPGMPAEFGKTDVTGLTKLNVKYVYELIPWKKGEKYDHRLIEKARRILFGTNLFSTVEFNNPGKMDIQGQLPITIKIRERSRRTIRVGLEYTTDYGPGINGSWTHRNLFGMAEKLTASAIFNDMIRTASLRFDKPMFLDKKNTLIADSTFNDETTDAYDARSVEVSTILGRQFTNTFRAGAGVGFRYGRSKQVNGDEYTTYHLAFLPLRAALDTRKDLLNPTQGYNLTLSMAPYQDVADGNLRFFRYLLSGSTYYNFNTGDKMVFAVRADFGQMVGVDHNEMPADLRFYAGGGGSVRGFAYQYAGPVKGNVPLGGLSTMTFSLELRFKITESIGLVPFLDGGTVFLNSVPDFGSQDLYYGTGLGLRYYTAIGPIRLDVATPINWREGVDSRYQIYVSIGQSF
jgi:translocation and assembly module TamA